MRLPASLAATPARNGRVSVSYRARIWGTKGYPRRPRRHRTHYPRN